MLEKIDELLLRARHLRVRAKEVLARADTMENAHARRRMRVIAVRYQRLAQRLEREADQNKE